VIRQNAKGVIFAMGNGKIVAAAQAPGGNRNTCA
jgi:hypothetical protein